MNYFYRKSPFLFENIHPIVGLLQLILRSFRDPKFYLIYVLKTLGIVKSLNDQRPSEFFIFFWFLSSLVMDKIAFTNDHAQMIKEL
jgi:hypothetical protein